MTRCLLSIVTVTFNDVVGLRRTLESLKPLLEEAGEAAEVVVQDGGTSGFPMGDLERDYPGARFESAKDGGIYEGMNRAVERCQGEAIWFLNGGDTCLVDNWGRLSSHLIEHAGAVLLFDFVLDVGRRLVSKKSRPTQYIWHALPTSHQAIIYPAAPLKFRAYDTGYRIVGDYELTARLFTQGVGFVRIEESLAKFQAGGMSHANAGRIAAEVRTVQRDVLGVPLWCRLISSAGHAVARWRRIVQTANLDAGMNDRLADGGEGA